MSESKNNKRGFMLVQEEEIVEEQELLQDDESKQNQANLELELEKFNAEMNKDDEIAIKMIKFEGQYKDREEDYDNRGKYQRRLISEIDEIEQLQQKIQQKKAEIITKKRKNKLDLNELLKDTDELDFNLKRRKI
ncbi:UNKNOWN [Stylonychia lemnae]|uniref:Uncharacterized protein n=1 Tax=Stylonychia lemnae TaxID=5949 RepID=A0A078B8J1_STYLE|nr:UNKNOWN [Stylonychia lemnae]|eukprot:CDW90835.1 UNKNOWN [Stylonychia lemnae]